jgi:hypothetical protein
VSKQAVPNKSESNKSTRATSDTTTIRETKKQEKVSKTKDAVKVCKQLEEEEEITVEESIERVRRHLRRVEQQRSEVPEVLRKNVELVEVSQDKTSGKQVKQSKTTGTGRTSTGKSSQTRTTVEEKEERFETMNLCELPVTLFPNSGRIKAIVHTPDGGRVPADLIPTANGQQVRYTPRHSGRHRVQVLYEDCSVESYGSVFEAIARRPGQAHAHGKGLIWGQVGRPCEFQVTLPSEDDHQLTVSVLGPCEVELDGEPVGLDTQLIRWTPQQAGLHRVVLLCDGHPVHGSPFPVTIVPPAPSTRAELQPQVNKVSESKTKIVNQTQTTNRLALLVRGSGLTNALLNVSPASSAFLLLSLRPNHRLRLIVHLFAINTLFLLHLLRCFAHSLVNTLTRCSLRCPKSMQFRGPLCFAILTSDFCNDNCDSKRRRTSSNCRTSAALLDALKCRSKVRRKSTCAPNVCRTAANR